MNICVINGYLMQYGSSRNKPTQKAMDLELFEVNANAITCAHGEVITRYTSKLTPKGQRYFIDRLIPAGELCETV